MPEAQRIAATDENAAVRLLLLEESLGRGEPFVFGKVAESRGQRPGGGVRRNLGLPSAWVAMHGEGQVLHLVQALDGGHSGGGILAPILALLFARLGEPFENRLVELTALIGQPGAVPMQGG